MLEGKVVVVTNAGQGLGRAIALLMADEGARVVVHDSDALGQKGGGGSSVSEVVVLDIMERGGDAVAWSGSVTSWEGSHDLVQTAVDHFGRLDILVNHVDHAEGRKGRTIFDLSREEWECTARVELKACFLCARAALPHMREQRQGRLIHFASAEAVMGGVGYAHHGAVQMAVVGLSRNAAIEMERYGVTSNCIVNCNGPGSVSDPADAAPLAVFLGSDAANGLSGQMFGVRGKEIFLFSQSRIQRSIHNSQGWTVERLSAIFESTMQRHFIPLESSDSCFCSDSPL